MSGETDFWLHKRIESNKTKIHKIIQHNTVTDTYRVKYDYAPPFYFGVKTYLLTNLGTTAAAVVK